MPTISRFFGIVIQMYYFPKEHPPAHFHAIYGDHSASVSIETLEPMGGYLPPRALGLVVEGARMHQAELLQNWRRCEAQQPLQEIVPLE